MEELEKGVMIAEISNMEVDMSGDVMNPQGCDSTLWEDSPLFLDEHDVKQTLGKGLGVQRTEKSLLVKFKFALDADKESDLYKRAFNAYEEYKTGARSKFSIGFIPLEVSTNPKVCQKYGENCKRYISKYLFIEGSCVAMPDNFSTKVIDLKDLKAIYGDKLETKNINGKTIEFKTIPCKKEVEEIKPDAEPISESGERFPTIEETVKECMQEVVKECIKEEVKEVLATGNDVAVIEEPKEKQMDDMSPIDLTEGKPELENKPYPNEIAARLENPDKYVKFRRDNNAGGEGVDFIYGITSDGKAELQTIRFDASKFTTEQAHQWLKEHDKHPIEFSPATEEKKIETKELPVYKPELKTYKPNVNIAEIEKKHRLGKIRYN